jgi:hypothetical protein
MLPNSTPLSPLLTRGNAGHEMAFTPISLATAGLPHAAGPEITSSGSVRISDSARISFTLGFATSHCRPCRAGRVCVRARDWPHIQSQYYILYLYLYLYSVIFLAAPPPSRRYWCIALHPATTPYAQYIHYPSDPTRLAQSLHPSHRRPWAPPRPAAATSRSNSDAFAVRSATTAICARIAVKCANRATPQQQI